MNKAFLFLSLVIISIIQVHGQKNDHILVLGYAGLNSQSDSTWGTTIIDFNVDPPDMYYEAAGIADITGTLASICDDEGDLVAYTNGMRVWGRDHQVIENGSKISDCFQWNQQYIASEDRPLGWPVEGTSLILQQPGHSNSIIIHSDQIFDLTEAVSSYSSQLLYSKINEGSNQIMTVVDSVLLNGIFTRGGKEAVRHANGKDWWISVNDIFLNAIHLFLLTEDSIKKISTISLNEDLPNSSFGQSVYSPNGDMFATIHVLNRIENIYGIHLYSFDRCVGHYEKIMVDSIKGFGIGLGTAFSLKQNYLYVSNDELVYQYDLKDDNIKDTRRVVQTYNGMVYNELWPSTLGNMWLAPDGKIYIASGSNSGKYLHVINNPELKGNQSNVVQGLIETNTRIGHGLPNTPNFRLGPIDGSPCDTSDLNNEVVSKWRYEPDTSDYLTINYTDLSYFEPDEWTWDFGDGIKSHYHSPSYTYDSPGTYEVCLQVTNEFSEDEFCKTIHIGTSAIPEVKEYTISVFPNPASEVIRLVLYDYVPIDGKIALTDLHGRTVLTSTFDYGENIIHIGDLNSGYYFVELYDENILLKTKKLVKL